MSRTKGFSIAFGLTFVLLVVATVLPLDAQTGSEDCIPFDPNRATVQRASGRWKIAVGNMWLLDFGNSRSEADQALSIIRHYRMDRQCFVGRPDPSLTYYLAAGAAPTGSMSGEDCTSFNPSTLEAKYVSGRWKIVEGDHWLLDFGNSSQEARQALSIIRSYGFDSLCFVGRPQPSFTYLKRSGATAFGGPSPAPPPASNTGTLALYGRPGCGLCKRMMQDLDRAGIAYTFFDVDQNQGYNRDMWNHVSRVYPGTDSVTLPVIVIDGAVLISPSFQEVQSLLASTASRGQGGSTATRPSTSGGYGNWDESMYRQYTHETFFDYPPAKQRIDPQAIDYPLLRAAFFYETNRLRVNMGRRELRYDNECAQIAQMHAEDMVEGNFLDHENPYDPSKRTVEDRAALIGLEYTLIRENITSRDISGTYIEVARDFVERWRKSSVSRKALLNVWVTHMGAGACDAGSKWEDLGLKVVQVYVQIPH
jgi:uncharacterized protein YkwD